MKNNNNLVEQNKTEKRLDEIELEVTEEKLLPLVCHYSLAQL